MTYLVDTNVISALAPTKAERPTAVIDWLDRRSDDLFLSVVTAAEIRSGIAKAARGGAKRKAENLAAWWDAVEHLYGERILPFDLKAATIAGALSDRAAAKGRAPGFADIAIAATAEARALVLLTRNTRDFEHLFDRAINPFETLPE
ncbi:MAG TPA: PIN domain-containing protein [Roseiarcus sp.]|nr:PIN domain-containing protein [Roseiarcus sp.]